MTSTNGGMRDRGFRHEVDQQKLGPALLIALSLVLAIRTACWDPHTAMASQTSIWKRSLNTVFALQRLSCLTLLAGIASCFQ